MADSNDRERDHPGAKAMDWLWKERQQTDEAIERVRGAGVGSKPDGLTIESAVLAAQSNRELAAATVTSAETLDLAVSNATARLDQLGARVDDLRAALSGAAADVKAEISAFTAATDASTRLLARWTKVMAWATIAIAIFAVAQVVVAVLAWLRPH